MRSGSTWWFRPLIHDFLANLLLVAATTLIIYAAATFFDAHYLIALYLVPIVFAMLRSGFAQGLVMVLLSALAVSFFFYNRSTACTWPTPKNWWSSPSSRFWPW